MCLRTVEHIRPSSVRGTRVLQIATVSAAVMGLIAGARAGGQGGSLEPNQLPLGSFETEEELAKWTCTGGARAELTSEHATAGLRAVRLTCPATNDLPGIRLEANYRTVAPSDWSKYGTFAVDVYNCGARPVILQIKFWGGDRNTTKAYMLDPQAAKTCRVDLPALGRVLDVRRVWYINFWFAGMRHEAVLDFDNVRLYGSPDQGPVGFPATAPDPPGYLVGVADSLTKVFQDPCWFPGAVEATAELSCARNEREAFQICVYAPTKDLEEVQVVCSDLRQKRGAGVVPSSKLTVYVVGYINTKRPYYDVECEGPWPDPLMAKPSFDVAQGKVQPIWLSVTVEDDRAPGDYEGQVTLKPANAPEQAVKVKLHVWDFAIPKDIHLRTGFGFYPPYIQQFHKAEGEKLDEMLSKYYLFMLSRRMMPMHNLPEPVLLQWGDGRYVFDFDAFDKAVVFCRAHGQTAFTLGPEWPWGHQGEWAEKVLGLRSAQEVVGVYGAWGAHLQQKGWLDLFYTYIVDESYHRVDVLLPLVHKGCRGIRNLQTVGSGAEVRSDLRDIDLWCPRINQYYENKADYGKLRKEGKEVWMYTAGATPPFPSLHLDVPAMEARIIPWLCWKEKLSGYLFWCVNYWTKDPWQDPMVYPEQNGNGSMFYPGESGPVASIRTEAFSDGMEDYEYLWLLDQQVERVKKLPASRQPKAELAAALKLLPVGSEVATSLAEYTKDTSTLLRYRRQVAEAIEKLAHLGGRR